MFEDIEKAVSILNECSNALNTRNHPYARKLLLEYENLSRNGVLPLELIFRYQYINGELALRTGHYKATLKEIEKNLCKFDKRPDLKLKLLLKTGRLECISNRLGISPKYFSEALALAESENNQSMIAQAYAEIAHMFSPRYQGLAMYFYRKAERAYAEMSDTHNLNLQKLERAFLCSITSRFKPALKHIDRIIDEAKEIIRHVDTSDFNPHEKRHYLYQKGVILGDDNIIKSLIDDISAIDALPDKCRYEDVYIGLCIEKGKFEKAKEVAKSYYKDARKLYGDTPEIKSREKEFESIVKAAIPIPFIPFHISPNTGDSTTLFDILDHYALQDELWALDKSPMRSVFPYHAQEGLFEPVLMPNGIYSLFPLGLAFNIYYRGQSKHYPVSKSTIYRNGITEAQQFVERLKYVEFRNLVENYPLTSYFKNSFYVISPDGSHIQMPLSIDPLALAQHYGIKTELMDVTTDKFVAAFFATTDCIDDKYYPITDNRKEKGAFYRYSTPPSAMMGINSKNRLRAVGLQPFSRPGEQKGLVYEMNCDDDFNKIVISTDYFSHNREVSEFIFSYMNRSKKLFPTSPLQTHADLIKKSKEFSSATLAKAKSEFYPETSEEIIQNFIADEQIIIVDKTDFGFSEDEIKECGTIWENGENERILSQIRPRFTYSGPIVFDE